MLLTDFLPWPLASSVSHSKKITGNFICKSGWFFYTLKGIWILTLLSGNLWFRTSWDECRPQEDPCMCGQHDAMATDDSPAPTGSAAAVYFCLSLLCITVYHLPLHFSVMKWFLHQKGKFSSLKGLKIWQLFNMDNIQCLLLCLLTGLKVLFTSSQWQICPNPTGKDPLNWEQWQQIIYTVFYD